MHHFPLHIGDFSKDTAPFTAEEVGVYLRLLMLYYGGQEPLPADSDELAFRTMSRSTSEKRALNHVLRRCFTLDDQKKTYTQKRCEAEIAKYLASGVQSRFAILCRHWDKVNKGVDKPKFEDFAKDPESYFDKDTGHVRKVTARKSAEFRLEDPGNTAPPPPNTNQEPGTGNQEPRTIETPVVPKGTPTVEALAEAIYALYPKKVGKGAAIKAIVKVLKSGEVTELELQTTVRAYAEAVNQWSEQDKTYVPNPSTWFNQKRYMDDPATWKRDEPAASLPGFQEKNKKGGGAAAARSAPEPEWDWQAVYVKLYGAQCIDEWSHLPKSVRFEVRKAFEKKQKGGGAAETEDDEEPTGWIAAWSELFEENLPDTWADVPPALQAQIEHHLDKKIKEGRADA